MGQKSNERNYGEIVPEFGTKHKLTDVKIPVSPHTVRNEENDI